MRTFNEASLLQKMTAMTHWSNAVFMACCCERMLPNYASFHEETGFGDLRILRGALDAAWCWIETGLFPEDAGNLVADCDRQAPNTAEFSSTYTSAALDAASAIATLIESLPHSTKEQAVEVASLARDTVDIFVQQRDSLDPNDGSLERRIAESELMQTELRVQQEILEAIEETQGSDGSLIASELREKLTGLGSLPCRS